MFSIQKRTLKIKIFLLISMIALVLSSCSKTVNSDNDLINTATEQQETITEKTETLETATPEITTETTVIFDQHIEDTITSGNAKVVINADIMFPDYTKIPTVYLTPQNLNAEQLTKVIDNLVGGNTVYYLRKDENSLSSWSKEELDVILSNLRLHTSNENLDENTKYHLNKQIEWLENQIYDISPYKSEEKIFDGTLTSIDNSGIYSHITSLKAYMNHDQAAWLNLYQSYKENETQIYFSNIYYGVYYDTLLSYKGIDAEKIDLSYEECLQIAEECIRAVDGENSNMALCNSFIGYSLGSFKGYTMDTSPQAYCFDFGRSYDGYVINPSNSLVTNENISKNEQIYTEKIRIVIDNDGIYQFSWNGHLEYKDIQYSNTEILEFTDIHNSFISYCNENKIWSPSNDMLPSDLTVTIDIYNIRLDLMLIGDGNGTYKTCPVWNYIGNVNYDKEVIDQDGAIAHGEQNTIILSINAVDGSIMEYPQKMN